MVRIGKLYDVVDALGNTQFSWQYLAPICLKVLLRLSPFIFSLGLAVADVPCVGGI